MCGGVILPASGMAVLQRCRKDVGLFLKSCWAGLEDCLLLETVSTAVQTGKLQGEIQTC